jgi:hypothetical protein
VEPSTLGVEDLFLDFFVMGLCGRLTESLVIRGQKPRMQFHLERTAQAMGLSKFQSGTGATLRLNQLTSPHKASATRDIALLLHNELHLPSGLEHFRHHTITGRT